MSQRLREKRHQKISVAFLFAATVVVAAVAVTVVSAATVVAAAVAVAVVPAAVVILAAAARIIHGVT